MSMALAELVEWVEADVPTRDGVPSESQYRRAVEDAALDLSTRLGGARRYGLEVVKDTAEYSLPDDFLSLIRVEQARSGEVVVTDEGVIPMNAVRPTFSIVGEQLVIYPTPTYSMTVYLWYRVKHVLDENDEYPDMSREAARLTATKAAAICLRLQANKTAQEAWQYQVGDERVSKENLSERLAGRASELEAEYLASVAKQGGPVGMRPYRHGVQEWLARQGR